MLFAGVGIGREILNQRGFGIDVSRRAELLGDLRQRCILRAEHTVLVRKMRHDGFYLVSDDGAAGAGVWVGICGIAFLLCPDGGLVPGM
ncbi:hypothetical protein D3C81_1739390 [compost metagenome]